jgi:hypothetical protein
MSDEYKDVFGNLENAAAPYDSQTNMDSRVRLNVKGTAAGGAYAAARIRMYESLMGDGDIDTTGTIATSNSNIWVDKAYVGIPFSDTFTLEMGKNRQTYGPLPLTYNFFYDDVILTGFKGIVKLDNVEINPFIEWMEEEQSDTATTADRNADNDEIRFGAHAKAKLNKDWTVGGILGYQSDSREGTAVTFEANEGFFGSLYANGKMGQFGIVGEIAVTDGDLNGLTSWYNDGIGTTADPDNIGSDDTGFGGYIFPNYQIDKLNIGLNIGFTAGGFQPDTAFGFVMIGSADNSRMSTRWGAANVNIGAGGDWLWIGLVPSYQINESLKLTANLVYADIDPWTEEGDGPTGGYTGTDNAYALDSAWEISAELQYTISKGADVYFSAGYMSPEFEDSDLEDEGAFAAMSRFELKF